MFDPQGFRLKLGIVAPSTNSVVEAEMGHMRPYGVSNHYGRIEIPNDTVASDADFDAVMDKIRGGLEAAVRQVMSAKPDRLVLGMSSETFWDGKAGSDRLLQRMEEIAGVPVTIGSHAVTHALETIGGIKKLAVLTPYWPLGDAHVRRYFEDIGYEVVAMEGLRARSPESIAYTPRDILKETIEVLNSVPSDAIVQVGTNLALTSLAGFLEFWLDKPVIAINTATYWHALRGAGIDDLVPGFGSLLTEH